MHHPEQYQAMVTGIHQDRLKEGLVSQEVSRSGLASSKWQKFSGIIVSVVRSAMVSTKPAVNRLSQINLKSKQSQSVS